MSWQPVFCDRLYSSPTCLRPPSLPRVPRISLCPIKPLHMRNEDCHVANYSCLSIFQPHFITEAKLSTFAFWCWYEYEYVCIVAGLYGL
ncbi:hypothetical protein V8C42DRAFT_329758 [Trichoderma barbatum]